MEVFNTATHLLLAVNQRQSYEFTFEVFCDDSPSFGTVLLHELDDFLVLFLRPRPFDEFWIHNFVPSLLTLYVGAVVEL